MESAQLLEKAKTIKRSVDELLQEKSRLSGRKEELIKSVLTKFNVSNIDEAKKLLEAKIKERSELSTQLDVLTREMEKITNINKV